MAVDKDLLMQLAGLREAFEHAWSCAKTATLYEDPGDAARMLAQCEKRLAEIAHRAAKIRSTLNGAPELSDIGQQRFLTLQERVLSVIQHMQTSDWRRQRLLDATIDAQSLNRGAP